MQFHSQGEVLFLIGSLSFLTERAEQLKKLITNHNMKYQNLNSGFQKGGVPAAPSGTATLLRLSPSHRLYPKTGDAPLFRYRRLPWLDGRCVQGPGTYSPRHG